ncbi:28S ribosomal protein S22, mitochondrial [Uranotaenia lowii]|uniref:28S ribosomal protein S22, mitochondrial n=1 Tax=Uranotaenia lowii TaxID=190385 RepID=UPI00247AB73A|nr:28S ribosomal protein S22, mitochondrial [Uranotaenia lowii]
MLKLSHSGARWTLEIFKVLTPFQSSARFCSVDNKSFLVYDKDPGPQFVRQDVQKLLRSMSRLELDKVFRKRSVNDNTVEYKFMTDEQLKGEVVQSISKARRLLQMPPVVAIMQDSPKVLSKDGALKGFSESKVVITDITYGVKNSKRVIVERLPDGTLQDAAYETRKRLNQIYFPLNGRKVRLPKMFEPGQLKKILENGEYEFVLDRACIQFEPYEQEYHDVTTTVYQHVAENKAFDALRSTRHFGPMCFFLAWHRLIDDLLLDMIKRDYLRNGVELITLYCSLNDVSLASKDFEPLKQQVLETDAPVFDVEDKTVKDLQQDEKYLVLIEQFVSEQSTKKVQLNLAIASYREMAMERQALVEGLRKMHGNS